MKNAVRVTAIVSFFSIMVFLSFAMAMTPFSADVKMKLNFKNQEITSMIESFASASKTTFVVDPSVRGKISVFAPEPVSLAEAFDLLSTSLALNGYAILDRDGKFVVMAARNATRSSVQTISEITSTKPERMVTWIVTLNHISASSASNQLRNMVSKDGEFTFVSDTNQLVITDFVSTVSRISDVVKNLDKPVSAAAAKFASKEAKLKEARMKQSKVGQTTDAKTETKAN